MKELDKFRQTQDGDRKPALPRRIADILDLLKGNKFDHNVVDMYLPTLYDIENKEWGTSKKKKNK